MFDVTMNIYHVIQCANTLSYQTQYEHFELYNIKMSLKVSSFTKFMSLISFLK